MSTETRESRRQTMATKRAAKPQLPYVIVRTYSAGVFAGELVSREGKEVVLANARCLWYWAGASSLSEMAMRGTARPADCKFPCPVARVTVTEAIEVLDTTPAARESIEGVREWTQHGR